MSNKNTSKLLLNEEKTSDLMKLSGLDKGLIKKFLKENKKLDEEEKLDEKEELEERDRSTSHELAKGKQKYGKIKEEEEVDEIKTKGQARAAGDTDRLYEGEEMGDKEEAPPPSPPPEMEPPPAAGGEANIEALVAAIADAITQQTGVPVQVSGGGAEPPAPEGGEMPPAPPAEEEPQMTEAEKVLSSLGYKKTNEGKYVKEELKEDAKQESARGEPKKTEQEKLDGAEKPEKPMGDKDPNKASAVKDMPKGDQITEGEDDKLEEAVAKRVLGRLLKEFKKLQEEKKQKTSKK